MAPLAPLFEFQVHPTRASLEAPLGKSAPDLELLAGRCDDGSAYRSGIQTIRGKSRFISVPKASLDHVQRRINEVFFPVDLSLGAAAHGYVAGRSTLTNAKPHTGASFLQKFDIRDFFPSITTERIESTLLGLGFGQDAASILSRLTSFRGTLPLGARTSPRVSNMVLAKLDDQLQAIALEQNLRYTRYADDLTFSSFESFDVSEQVVDKVGRIGFSLNSAKSRRFKHGQPMFVTGLSVEDQSYPRVRKRLKARLRQEFYYIEKFGLAGHAAAIKEDPRWTASRLTGQFHYCRTVEPAFTEALTREFPRARTSVVPEHHDSRAERAQRYRREFLSEVAKASPQSLDFYEPTVLMFERQGS
jgi:hypothetical protein